MSLAAPVMKPLVGHLDRWGLEPLALLEEGARKGEHFELRLWRRAVVGYRPQWNRRVLGDLDTFRSRGSLSAMTPYLNGGVVMTDSPGHRPRRGELNPHTHARALGHLAEELALVVDERLPRGRFDALQWSLELVPALLNRLFFAGAFPQGLLESFLAPLHRPLPGPLLPRPLLFRRVTREIERQLRAPRAGAIVGHLGSLEGAAEEVRVALAAGFDTTSHTLAWALWHLAGEPRWNDPEAVPLVVKETLRLYPAGWVGSRVAARPFEVGGTAHPAGRLVFYCPWLTHRDPELWEEPLRYDPGRFERRVPAWAYIPFSAGERICLGMHIANLMLHTALAPFAGGRLRAVSGDARPRTGLTLSPVGPLIVETT